MKSYSSRDVLQILKENGWYIDSICGDHYQLKHSKKHGKTTVAHPVKQVPINNLKSIEKQAGIKFS